MILISVREAPDVMRAQAFVEALEPGTAVALLCHDAATRALAEQRGLTVCADALDWLLNVQRVSALVSLRATTADGSLAELGLVTAFDQLGIPTIALQRSAFQLGFELRLGTVLYSVGAAPAEPVPASIACAARHTLGFDVVGPLAPTPRRPGTQSVACFTDLHAAHYDESERHRIVLALLALWSAAPELRFVWRPHPAEASHAGALALAQLVGSYELPNLTIERRRFAEDLIADGPSALVCTLGTPLVLAERGGLPALVFAGGRAAALRQDVHARFFSDPDELCAAFAALRAHSGADFVPRTGISAPAEGALQDALARILPTRRLVPDHLARALAYADRSPGGAPTVHAATAVPSLGPVLFELRRVLDKLGVVQRSTLAYKAKRLVGRLRP